MPPHHMAEQYSRIWDPIISYCLKQWIWPRTGLCGGCGRRMALRSLELRARNDDDDIITWLLDVKCRSFIFNLFQCFPRPTSLSNSISNTFFYAVLITHHSDVMLPSSGRLLSFRFNVVLNFTLRIKLSLKQKSGFKLVLGFTSVKTTKVWP